MPVVKIDYLLSSVQSKMCVGVRGWKFWEKQKNLLGQGQKIFGFRMRGQGILQEKWSEQIKWQYKQVKDF